MADVIRGGFLRDDATSALRIVGYADRDNGQPGIYAPGPPNTSQAVVANTARLSRFVPSRSMTIIKIGFAVSVAASLDDPFDVGIYDVNLARLVSSGATSGKLNAIGQQSIAITPFALTAGTIYYAAGSVGAIAGTAATLVGTQYLSAGGARLFGTANGRWEVDVAAASHPLPNPIVPSGPSGVGFTFALLEV